MGIKHFHKLNKNGKGANRVPYVVAAFVLGALLATPSLCAQTGKTLFRFTPEGTSAPVARPQQPLYLSGITLASYQETNTVSEPIAVGNALQAQSLDEEETTQPPRFKKPEEEETIGTVDDIESSLGETDADAQSLEDVWRIALESSRKLQAQDYDYAGAQQKIRAARGVALPKIANASGRHSVSEQYAIEGNVTVPVMGMKIPFETEILDKDFSTSITTLTVPLYMGGRVRGMIEAAGNAASAIASGKEISQLDLKMETAQTYFLVFRVRKLLEVAREAERTFAAHEKDARRMFDNGIVTRNVLLAAEVAHANARQDVLKAENAATLSEAALNRLLWRPLDTPVHIVDIPVPDPSGDLELLTEEALEHRPELQALTHKSNALAAQAKVKRADRLPQVALVGSHNYIENSHLNTNSSFSGSVGVVWMPIDGGISRATQHAASYESLSAAKEYEDARTGIELQVYQAWLDEKETRERIEVARDAVNQATENLRVTNRSFREGMVNHTEVLDATALWTQAQSNLANARYDAILATYKLRRAIGRL